MPPPYQTAVNVTSVGRSPSVFPVRYEEVVQAKQGLAHAKRENEVLVQRIKEMERRLRGQKGDTGGERVISGVEMLERAAER